jgi:hypothetical protein
MPLSPYTQEASYLTAGGDKTLEFFYAIKNFKEKDISVVDSFVKCKMDSEYLKKYDGVNFIFYNYEKGRIDENYVQNDKVKQQNLFMEAGAEILLKYKWERGKFVEINIYKKGRNVKFEKKLL